MTDFAVSALTRKRAELAGEIEAGEVRLHQGMVERVIYGPRAVAWWLAKL